VKRVPELLAPAGDWDALVAAVQNGADAVYLGGKGFNARRQAPNFTARALAEAIEYAHVRGVKVYVTVNTIIADEEMEEAARFLRFVYEAGADAVIVQDLGLLRLARMVLPELPLHASTQMTVHNTAGALLVGEAGGRRIVLARELSLREIEALKKGTGLEVEVFVHGALCICYSGQCLMSSLIGGRSGNRGMCAQPCRLPYTLCDAGGRAVAKPEEIGAFLLSPRDLNLSHHLPALAAAGVDALKIEGRMKRAEYVATVVRIYRRLLDRLAAGRFFVLPEETLTLAQIFNRGFSSGYLSGRPGRDLMSYRRPNNRGVPVGRVLAYDRRRKIATVKLNLPLRVGDGIEFWVSEGGRVGAEVRRLLGNGGEIDAAPTGAVVKVAAAGRIRPGDRVFKTADAALLREAQASFNGQEIRKIPVVFRVHLREGEPLRVMVADAAGHSGAATTQSLAVRAEKRPLTLELLREQLGRLGNTPFELVELAGEVGEGLFIPVSEINAVRREAITALAQVRARVPQPLDEGLFAARLKDAVRAPDPGARGAAVYLAVSCGTLSAVKAAVAAGADRIYFGGEEFRFRAADGDGGAGLAAVADYVRAQGREFFLLTPRVAKDAELAAALTFCQRTPAGALSGVVAGNLGLLRALIEAARVPVWADYYLNVFNLQAVTFLQERGAKGAVLSPELTLRQVEAMAGRSPLPLEVLVHGRLPLMVSEYCVVGAVLGGMGANRACSVPCRGRRFALRDRLDVLFPVYPDTACRMHIFNSQELVMLRFLPALVRAGVAGLRIEARLEDAAYVSRVTRAYRQALDAALGGAPQAYEKIEEELAGGDFTRGHYFRGVV
jgi:putative protease